MLNSYPISYTITALECQVAPTCKICSATSISGETCSIGNDALKWCVETFAHAPYALKNYLILCLPAQSSPRMICRTRTRVWGWKGSFCGITARRWPAGLNHGCKLLCFFSQLQPHNPTLPIPQFKQARPAGATQPSAPSRPWLCNQLCIAQTTHNLVCNEQATDCATIVQTLYDLPSNEQATMYHHVQRKQQHSSYHKM